MPENVTRFTKNKNVLICIFLKFFPLKIRIDQRKRLCLGALQHLVNVARWIITLQSLTRPTMPTCHGNWKKTIPLGFVIFLWDRSPLARFNSCNIFGFGATRVEHDDELANCNLCLPYSCNQLDLIFLLPLFTFLSVHLWLPSGSMNFLFPV